MIRASIGRLCRAVAAALVLVQGLVLAGVDEHAARRAHVLGLMDSSSALVLHSAEVQTRTADVNHRFRQESNLLYLTGENRPGLTLLLAPRGIHIGDTLAHIVLFANPAADDGAVPLRPIADGITVHSRRFHDVFAPLLPEISTLYASSFSPAFMADWLNNKPMFIERESRKELEKKYPNLKVKNASPLVARARVIKSPWEVERIRTSIAATGEGLRKAMELCRPGVREYELQAAIEYEMMRRGASAPSFPSIIGSGPNALILHYEHNHRTAVGGELVVMDVGAEIEGYAADITRTIPVSGTFTSEQKKVYNAVLHAHDSIIANVRAGMPWSDLDKVARRVLAAEGFEKFWRHSVSHQMGIDVHDVGKMDTLQVGMVFTVEPGVYIPEKDTTVAPRFRGIGVRIEDDVLVTERGAVVLSEAIPREIKDIERIMRKPKR
ncbi:MAG TPA: aminopeptidase P N-terminal domain-containing protein [Bacteroidota bacterium]|nr:aminopeptidase P N-terminal domain-containing protein [Bacteroidota bacterium]